MLRALAAGLLTRKLMTGLSRRGTTARATGRSGTAVGARRSGGLMSNPMVRMAGMAGMGYMANRMLRGRGRSRGMGLGF